MLEIRQFRQQIVLSTPTPGVQVDKVPAKVYSIHLTPANEIVLTPLVDTYRLPETIYGISHHQRLKAIGLNYESRKSKTLNTGVLLSGNKGSGKTLLAEAMANEMVARERPVFYVDQPLSASVLKVIAKTVGECMFLFDEFDKVYRDRTASGEPVFDKQEDLLAFFSSTEFSGVLNVLLTNTTPSEYLLSRPQRICLHIKFDSITSRKDHLYVLNQFNVPDYFKLALLNADDRSNINLDSILHLVNVLNESTELNDRELLDYIALLNISVDPLWQLGVYIQSASDQYLDHVVTVSYDVETSLKHCLCVNVAITNAEGELAAEKQFILNGYSNDCVFKGLRVTIRKEELLLPSSDLGTYCTTYSIQKKDLMAESEDPKHHVDSRPVSQFMSNLPRPWQPNAIDVSSGRSTY